MTNDKPTPKPEAPKPLSEADQKLWKSIEDTVHGINHYQKGEGPTQALTRLREQGLLSELAIDGDLRKVAHQMVKKELGAKGEKHRNFYTTQDSVLSAEKEHDQVATLFEKNNKQLQADRLTPSVDQIKTALTPEVADHLHKAGLDVDPQKLRDAMVARLQADKGLDSLMMEKMKGFPVGAPYVATGAVTGAQMDGVLAEQKTQRDARQHDEQFQALKTSNPDEYKKQWGQFLQDTDVGSLLRKHAQEDPQHYNLAKIQAADELIKGLQSQQKRPG